MIVDQIKFIERYKNLDGRVELALEFLQKTNFKDIAPGIYKISGDDLFYIISDYNTRSAQDSKLEGHEKYIDIHSVIYGDELIGYSPLTNQAVSSEYNNEKDYTLYEGSVSLMKMIPGMFAIFYPNDLHMPGIYNMKKMVKKLVIKVRIT
jgi:YhcH/YjgK/YiaL family protein